MLKIEWRNQRIKILTLHLFVFEAAGYKLIYVFATTDKTRYSPTWLLDYVEYGFLGITYTCIPRTHFISPAQFLFISFEICPPSSNKFEESTRIFRCVRHCSLTKKKKKQQQKTATKFTKNYTNLERLSKFNVYVILTSRSRYNRAQT